MGAEVGCEWCSVAAAKARYGDSDLRLRPDQIGEQEQAKVDEQEQAKVKCGGPSTAQRTMRPSVAPVGMTDVEARVSARARCRKRGG